MPAPSWRMRPARSSSLWLTTSASAGSSRKVGMKYCDQRISVKGRRGDGETGRRGDGMKMSVRISPHRPVAPSPRLPGIFLRPFINFLCDCYQRQAARRADQTFEFEQRHEAVCEVGLSHWQVIAFEQSPVDEPGESGGGAEKFHFANGKAGLLQFSRQFTFFIAPKMTDGAVEFPIKKPVRRHEQRQDP